MCLLLGATGVGKTLLLKRLQKLCQMDPCADLGEAPVTLPTVGTNLTDLILKKKKKKITVRELGGCMGPIWPKYYLDCKSVIFVVDCVNVEQISSSCVQLLSVLSAESLLSAAVLILFNKRDLLCSMSLVELKSLFRMDDIIKSAPQFVTILEVSARSGQGLQDVLHWLSSNLSDTSD
ncbi:ADP-ribosylation factor-like protein 16 isoform X1 [Danio rerio]|uniref:ADP-ribosylation factor-like 16 n=1 Tax=Danio rerio TaxID=7955 RepID=F1QAH7_DANRE|nr:ADP-ribosylation factor-like protein 16 [Danio rerio]|eukprot:NP_001082969.2 ADP-ribosylation factor-like protein 16 [Danio rerio]